MRTRCALLKRVTIPKKVRDRAGIVPRSEVEFAVDGEKKVPAGKKPGMSRGEKVVAALRGTRSVNKGLSTDEIMKLLRGDD